jgi:hypothetical protein
MFVLLALRIIFHEMGGTTCNAAGLVRKRSALIGTSTGPGGRIYETPNILNWSILG